MIEYYTVSKPKRKTWWREVKQDAGGYLVYKLYHQILCTNRVGQALSFLADNRNNEAQLVIMMTVSTDMNKPKCSGKAQLFLILRQRGSSPMGPEWQEYIQCDDPVTSHILLVTIKVSSTGLVPEWTPLPPSTLLCPTRRPITDMTFCKRDSVHSQVIEPWRFLAPSGLGLKSGTILGV